MTKDQFLNTIAEAIDSRATLNDVSRFHIEHASGNWTRTYWLDDKAAHAINHKQNQQDQEADTFPDVDALFDDLWRYHKYTIERDHVSGGRTYVARPEIVDPDRTEPVYAGDSERVIQRVRRGQLGAEVVDQLDALPYTYLSARDNGTIEVVDPADNERYELDISVF